MKTAASGRALRTQRDKIMTQITPPPARSDVEAFIGQVVTDLSAAVSGVLVKVGRKLCFYQKMAELGACSSASLAEATGIRERYVREWLANQAAGGYVVYDSAKQIYALPPAQALVLAHEESPVFMAAAFEVAASFWLDEDKIVETFRSGEGLGWHAHNHRLFCGTESFFRNGYRASLTSEWLPALDGVVERLQRGARVADIGCGHGASTILMAQAFPKSRFIGQDYHDASIAIARRRAAEQGVTDNIAFEVKSATEFDGHDFDLICFLDCLHDLGDPVGALARCREGLKADGKVLLVEPYAGDRLEENLNPIGRMYYAASAMACTPNSLSQEVGLGLGAQAGEERLREVARQAGFSNLRRAAQTPVNLILELTP
jgi:SAM-dependent methyltransferase